MAKDEVKKVLGEEVTDDELDLVAGGVSKAVWDTYTVEQKNEARIASLLAIRKREKCTTMIDS